MYLFYMLSVCRDLACLGVVFLFLVFHAGALEHGLNVLMYKYCLTNFLQIEPLIILEILTS